MSRDTGGSAFPYNVQTSWSAKCQAASVGMSVPDMSAVQGMTLRDYLAAKAMQSIIAASKNITVGVGEETTNLNIAYASFSIADAMLKATTA